MPLSQPDGIIYRFVFLLSKFYTFIFFHPRGSEPIKLVNSLSRAT